jgi:hypothetical protein
MATPDIVVIVNALGALLGLSAFIRLARVPLRDARRLGVAGAILAVCYVVGYVWFLFHPGSVAPWSSTMRSVSVVAWPVVWALTPLLLARVCREVLALNASAGKALEDAQSCPAPRMTEEDTPT